MSSPILLHSVSYAGLWGQKFLAVDDFIDKAAALGYDGVMLMAKRPHVSPLDYGPQERARLRAHLEKKKLSMGCLAAYTNFTADLEHGDIPHREIQISYVRELARLTSDLGGKMIRIFTGYEHPAMSYGAQWRVVTDALRECARRAAEYGVTIGVQNHHDVAVSSESLYDLIQAVNEPNCKAMYDAWAPALHGDDIAEGARRMAPITVHTTAANYQKRRRFHYDPGIVNYNELTPTVQAVPIDEGFIDYRAFFGELWRSGFNGSIAYELCSPVRDGSDEQVLDRYARKFVEYVTELRQGVGEHHAVEQAV